ncbi:MAG: phenylalanine--tRNA ligase subunit alpha [Actinobacteria bacterium]|nr:phenylalanine--tRNA ligase subunit alpha [Actinomycetota bacterium]
METNKELEDLQKRLNSELEGFKVEIAKALNLDEVRKVKTRYIGPKSLAIKTLGNIGSLSRELRPLVGKEANIIKKTIEAGLEEKEKQLKSVQFNADLRKEKMDLSLPGRHIASGRKNIISQVIDEIEAIFVGMGFDIAEGPEVETDYYNFEALNTPADHPARSLHDTFFISDDVLLRTHTSPVQIRYMEKNNPPVYIIVPGKVYRKDYDISHTPMFTQIEGLVIDKNISFGNLKWTLETFVHEVFGKDRKVRFRPHYFPFTEPSAEVDVSCNICSGKGCRVCSGSGWLEILGAGMVDPNLYSYVNYNAQEVNGFAFGMGIERICMLKYGITDIRLFYENDIRFLEQF